MSSGTPVILVISSGLKYYRDYLMSAVARRAAQNGLGVWLINGTAPTWQNAYVDGCTVMNVHDHPALAATVRTIAAEHPIAGVICWDEPLVIPSTHIAHELGVPGLGLDGVIGCRDKHRTRTLLTEAGVAQPRYALVSDRDQAVAAAAEIGYPVVVKPRALGASIGVVLAADERELHAAYTVATGASLAGDAPYQRVALVEEYLDGPEISIDGAVYKGEFLPLFLARKDTGIHPYFEELGHVVDAADPLLADPELLDLLTTAHRVLGVQNGMTHTEIRLTRRGPVIVEVNGRLGGDLIPYLGKLGTGIEPGEILFDIATGVRPDITPLHRSAAGIRFAYPEYDIRVESIALPKANPDDGLVSALAMVTPGTELRLPPGGYIARYALVIAAAADHDACVRRLDRAMADVRLAGTPLGPPAPGAAFQMPAGLLDVD
jgi:biotin carboxylase